MSDLIQHPSGNYRFLPGGVPYSSGVVADCGYEIVHVTLRRPIAWRDGFALAAKTLALHNRPKTALCAMELRSPEPFSVQGFDDFNQEYCGVLRDWGVHVDDANPVARTNVCPEAATISEPSLYAFSFVRPSDAVHRPTFVVAGAGEVRSGAVDRNRIVRLGETSVDAIVEKARYVCGVMEDRLQKLGGGWGDVSVVNVYTVHPIEPHLQELLLQKLASGARHGLHWHYTRPPVVDIEFELDVRGTASEIWL
jgi:hypothetical protein